MTGIEVAPRTVEATPTTTDGLSVDGLSVRFDDVQALDDVSLAVDGGEIVGFVGPNGAGKTTTMRAVFDLVAPTSGTVRWAGRPIDRERRRRFGYMPEERGLYAKMRVFDQVVYFARAYGCTEAEATEAAKRLITRMGLADRADSPLEKLSLGNQQRVQLAVALVHEPELLVLDEPFSGLDPVGVALMSETLRAERDRGAAVLFSSHQLDLVERVCDRVCILSAGRIVASGTLEELREQRGSRRWFVDVRGAEDRWWSSLPGVRVADPDGDQRVLALTGDTDDRELLEAAQRAGDLEAFYVDRPTLADLFGDVVDA